MKIALIEDRIGRMKQFSEFKITDLPSIDIITEKKFSALLLELDSGSATSLDTYECIILHRSAFTIRQRDVIKEHCKLKNKPLVFFSGGISSSIYADNLFPFLHINSKDLYSNHLKYFVDDFEINRKINILILQFGARWKLNLLLNMRNNLNTGIEQKIIRRIRDLRINELLRSELLSRFDMSWLKDSEINNVSNEQIVEFKNKLNRLINESI